VSEWSDNLVGPVLANQIEGLSIGLVLEVSTHQKQMIKVPSGRVLWYPEWIWWHASHLIQDIWWQWYVSIMT
jgi:hypothetical protein